MHFEGILGVRLRLIIPLSIESLSPFYEFTRIELKIEFYDLCLRFI